jgi:polysaccharide biosynthesis protein PslG
MSRYSSWSALLVAAAILFALIYFILPGGQAPDESNVSRSSGNSKIFGIADPDLIYEGATTQASQLAAMRAIGITSVRVDADWNWIQPTGPKTFYWTKLDQEVHSIRAAGMSVDLIIDGCPRWAALAGAAGAPSPQPASSAQYASWAADVAARYAPEGVNDFEIWNEPNIVRFWQPKPNPAAYTADLMAAYVAIKKVDRSAFVISGGLAPAASDGTNFSPISFLTEMYAHGVKGSFDALGYHPYSFPAAPDSYEPWSAWSQMNQARSSIRSMMTKNGDSGKPIWITEFGAPSNGPSGISASAQSAELSQAIAYAKKVTWIGAMYIYTWQDSVTLPAKDNWFGLLTEDGSPKPAYYAVSSGLVDTEVEKPAFVPVPLYGGWGSKVRPV